MSIYVYDDILIQIYSLCMCMLTSTYICLYVPIHTLHVHVSELVNLCPWQ